MIRIYLYGKLRRLADNPNPTSESILQIEYIQNENVEMLFERLGIDLEEAGELFVNHLLADLDTIIPFDNSRVGIFSRGMNLIDGGLHLKGHGMILKSRKKGNYY